MPPFPRTPLILPGFDELLLAYSDRSAFVPLEHKPVISQPNGLFSSTVIIRGKLVAVWRRTFKKETVSIEVLPIVPLDRDLLDAIRSATEKFAAFHKATLDFDGRLKPMK